VLQIMQVKCVREYVLDATTAYDLPLLSCLQKQDTVSSSSAIHQDPDFLNVLIACFILGPRIRVKT
jgi:hypothetical protein